MLFLSAPSADQVLYHDISILLNLRLRHILGPNHGRSRNIRIHPMRGTLAHLHRVNLPRVYRVVHPEVQREVIHMLVTQLKIQARDHARTDIKVIGRM